ALNDLERVGHVSRARNAGEVAGGFRIVVDEVGLVLVQALQRFRLVRDLPAFDHAETGGERADGTDQAISHWIRARVMRLEVPVGGVHHLPDAVEVRLAVDQLRLLDLLLLRTGLGVSRTGRCHDERCRSGRENGNSFHPPKTSLSWVSVIRIANSYL